MYLRTFLFYSLVACVTATQWSCGDDNDTTGTNNTPSDSGIGGGQDADLGTTLDTGAPKDMGSQADIEIPTDLGRDDTGEGTDTDEPDTSNPDMSSPPDGDSGDELTFRYDFADGASGWTAGIADYTPVMLDIIEFEAGIAPLPDEIAEKDATGFRLKGANRSDDLAMYLTRPLGPDDGIEPDQAYTLEYRIVFASKDATGCVGIGGPPGESVYLKAGATNAEPETAEDSSGVLRLNADIGNQSQSGADASVVSDIANGIPCDDAFEQGLPYVSLERTHTHTIPVTSDPSGNLWLLVLTDSGFEGTTTLYYQTIEATLRKN